MPGDDKGALDRDDLFLLLESYRNSITLNTTLLEQQKKLLEKQGEIINRQGLLFDRIDEVLNGMSNHAKRSTHIEQALEVNQIENEAGFTKLYSKLANKIYVGWIGMGVIIISLIGLFTSWLHNCNLIKEIAKHLGVG